jgi:sterol desaturase/sphingolipid hydroxylase (fatty acid hydroxylase superfamily)
LQPLGLANEAALAPSSKGAEPMVTSAAPSSPPVVVSSSTSLARPSWPTLFVFPALLGALLLGSRALLARGLPPPAVAGISLVSCVFTLLFLERLAPLHRAWNRRPEVLDLVLIVGNRLIDVAIIAGALALLGRLEAAGAPVAALRVWPAEAPFPLQVLLGLLLGEALRYAMHTLSHRPGLLWWAHHTHHEPTRMYALNGPRLHPLNQAWFSLANTLPLLALGAPLATISQVASVTALFVLLQHANVSLRFDGWNQLFATPDVHRLHHSRTLATAGVNFGIVLLVFDRLFGTYRKAEAPIAEDGIGL